MQYRNFINRFLTFLLFLIWPLGAVFYSIYSLYKNKDIKFSLGIIVSFIALFGYLLNTPDGDHDLTRIYDIYRNLKSFDWKSLKIIAFVNGDLSYYFYWLCTQTGISPQVIGFLSAGFLYGGIIYFMWKMISTVNKKGLLLGCIFTGIVTIQPMLVTGVRTAVGLGLFLIGLALYFQGEYIKSSIWFILSMCIHFLFAPLVLLIYLFYKLSKKSMKRLCLFFLLGGILFYPLMNALIKFLAPLGNIGLVISSKIEGYILNRDNFKDLVGLTAGSRVWLFQTIFLIVYFFRFSYYVHKDYVLKGDVLISRLGLLTSLIISFAAFNLFNLYYLGRILFLINILCITYLAVIKYKVQNIKWNKQINRLYYFLVFIALFAFIQEFNNTDGFVDFFKYESYLLIEDLFSILNTQINL